MKQSKTSQINELQKQLAIQKRAFELTNEVLEIMLSTDKNKEIHRLKTENDVLKEMSEAQAEKLGHYRLFGEGMVTVINALFGLGLEELGILGLAQDTRFEIVEEKIK